MTSSSHCSDETQRAPYRPQRSWSGWKNATRDGSARPNSGRYSGAFGTGVPCMARNRRCSFLRYIHRAGKPKWISPTPANCESTSPVCPFPHLFFEFILSHSGWRFVDLAFGETFEALQKGLQGALWALGGLPQVVRTDNLSAATHELKETKGRTLTQRYAALLEHYGLQATRTNPRSSHENGVAEQAHYRLKTALAQALIIRGSRDFPSVAGYSAFVQGVVDKSNRRVQGKLDVERPYLRSLPQAAVPEYTTWRTKVKKWSTIRVTNKTYSVPSRLCGHEVKVHQYADYLEVYYKDHMVERLERVRGEHKSRIDYRHIIWSLVRKPGAFARYRFREHLFPTPVKRKPTMPWAVGMVDGRMWSTSASCTWQPAPWRPEWSGLSPSSF